MLTKWLKVIEGVSFYQVTQCLLSHQWLRNSKLLRVISKNHASTLTECMTMPCTVVDAEYQKVTEWVCGTCIFYHLADSVKFCSLVFGRPCSCKYCNGIYVMYCAICNRERIFLCEYVWDRYNILKRKGISSRAAFRKVIKEQKSYIHDIRWSVLKI